MGKGGKGCRETVGQGKGRREGRGRKGVNGEENR